MNKGRVAWGVLVGLALAHGCGDDGGGSGDQACEPGRQSSCACATGAGVQVCEQDGSGWGPCDCGGTGGSTSSSGTGGSSSSGTGGTVPTGPSCDGLADTCGSAEDCCTSLVVPGGTYYRSYDGIDHTDMGNPATVSTFALDRFEVTVGRFRAFVDAGKGTQADPPPSGDGAHPLISNTGWDSGWNAALVAAGQLPQALDCPPSGTATWTDVPAGNESKPINCISWYEAFAFCAWDGGRLPTEAEWNYAATGGDEQRYYPWSASYPPGSTTVDSTYSMYGCSTDCTQADIPAVGSRTPKGDGRWGQADLTGSIYERVLDWHVEPYPNPCVDCAKLVPGDPPYHNWRAQRGAGYVGGPGNTSDRGHAIPEGRIAPAGARCARDL